MDIDFWHERWEKDEIAFHMDEVNPMLLKHFPKISLEKQKRIFIPLCGKTLDIAWLIQQGYKIVANEINEDAIISLFEQLDIKANIYINNIFKIYSYQNLKIYVGDFFDLSYEILEDVDFTYDRAALVALPEFMRKRYIEHLLKITKAVPQLLLSYEYDQSIMKGPPFSVLEEEIKNYYQDIYTLRLLEENEDIPSGLKRKSKANERVWLLNSKR